MPLSAADVRALDANAAALGVSTAALMENAGAAVARAVQDGWPKGSVVVLAGLGNNGGDGLVAARHLHDRGRDVTVFLAGPAAKIRSSIAHAAYAAAVAAGVKVVEPEPELLDSACKRSAVIVDALLGVGAIGSLRPAMGGLVRAARASGRPVLAVDLPTGHGTSDALPAVRTLTLHERKQDMDGQVCGDIVVADIGIPLDARRFVGPGDLTVRYPRTPAAAHKGMMGRLLVVGGGPYTGAPTLAALGALATGTDLLHVAAPGYAAEVAMQHVLEAIVHPLPGTHLTAGHVEHIAGWWDVVDVLLIGPGLGRHEETVAAVHECVDRALDARKRLVLDADGLSAFAGYGDVLRRAPVVLTPHAGEFLRLTDIDVRGMSPEARIEAVQAWLDGGSATVLLKGAEDVIVSADQAVRNRVHHPAMTTGGTGDVLAGCVAALLGRGASAFDAARLAAYWVGAAGVAAHANGSYAVRATDLPRAMPTILQQHLTRTASA